MKKVLLSITAGLLSVTMASAQCTPLATYADSTFGLWPDSATFRNNSALTGTPYSSQIDLKTFVDTSFSGQTVKIDAFKILSVTGLPAGFAWTGGGPTWDGTNTWYNLGATAAGTPDPSLLAPVQGCLTLSADAAAVTAAAPASGQPVSVYPLVVNVDIRIGDAAVSFLVGQWASTLGQAVAVDSYYLTVDGTVGVLESLNSTRFDVGQNYPNPATGETVFTFNTPTSSTVEFSIYNMLGVVVATEVINSEAGLNTFKFNTNDLSSGMYVYSLRSNGSTITKRMTVK